GVYHVKRVLGTPGDRVDYIDGELFINGDFIDEPYIYEGISTRGFNLEDICHVDECDVIPADYFLVLGDYRELSGDSRIYGLIHHSQILGRVVWRIRPFSEFGAFE
ncbi:MAG: signal peptidase I, partial [Turicibacter sp.]|nr:signal peptidase I [Turicibacter sp.]